MKIVKIKTSTLSEDVLKFKKGQSLKEDKDKKTETGLILGTREPIKEPKNVTPVIDHNLAKAQEEDEFNKKEREDALKAHDKEINELKKSTEKEPKIKTDKKTGLFAESLKNTYKGNFIIKEGYCGIRLKDRKELSALLESIKDYKVHARVRRAITEGYRYFVTFNINKILKEDLEMLPAVDITGAIDANDVVPNIEEKEVDDFDITINSIITMFNDAIVDEYKTVDKYNSIIATLTSIYINEKRLPKDKLDKIIESIKDIISEEHMHVGQFQEMSAILKPETQEDVNKGKEEVQGLNPAEMPSEVEEPVK